MTDANAMTVRGALAAQGAPAPYELTSRDRERRDALHADMSSADAKRRQQALRDLRSLYYQ
jgi:hypothetical protein